MAKFSFYAPPPPVVEEEAAEVPAAAVDDRAEEAVVGVSESAEGRRRRPSKWYPTPSGASTSPSTTATVPWSQPALDAHLL